MGNTTENLKAAFAGESQANRRYLFFADEADQAGQKRAARLFRAAADAETVHARNHLKALGEIKSAGENLQTAIGGEHYEFTKMYPEFIDRAKSEKNEVALQSFTWANKVEEVHHGLFKRALRDLESGEGAEGGPFFVCQRCGNTVEGEAPEKCPVCGAPRSMFKQVD